MNQWKKYGVNHSWYSTSKPSQKSWLTIKRVLTNSMHVSSQQTVYHPNKQYIIKIYHKNILKNKDCHLKILFQKLILTMTTLE